MREIKFRAWDLKTKSFYKPTYRALEGKLHDISITLDGIVMERTLEHCASMLNNDNYILMQYTGLKDKNGKEIYEGDVVKDYYCEYVDDKYNVGFSDGFFYPLVQVEQGYNCIDKYDKNRFEVIGNIYENPELLK